MLHAIALVAEVSLPASLVLTPVHLHNRRRTAAEILCTIRPVNKAALRRISSELFSGWSPDEDAEFWTELGKVRGLLALLQNASKIRRIAGRLGCPVAELAFIKRRALYVTLAVVMAIFGEAARVFYPKLPRLASRYCASVYFEMGIRLHNLCECYSFTLCNQVDTLIL